VIDAKSRIVAMWKIPYLEDEPDIQRLKRMFRAMKLKGAQHLILEEQQVFHKEGPVGAFTNGFGYATLKTCLAWSEIKGETRKPGDWKRDMKIPVPSMPTPKLPTKPATKNGMKEWNKTVKKIRARAGVAKKKKRKELACRKAQELAPGYDFRTSKAWNAKVNDGKCEAFLLAVLAKRTAN